MTKTKYLLYAFKIKRARVYQYWYETDGSLFRAERPPQYILDKNSKEVDTLEQFELIDNPWQNWNSRDIQTIVTDKGVCINYLKSTHQVKVQKEEDLKLLELYSYLVDNFDISKAISFDTVKLWHKEVFKTIYPFAGRLRSVTMSKGEGEEAWEWRLEFLNSIPTLDRVLRDISSNNYDDIDKITLYLAKLLSEFLFIHPFREGNGRVARLVSDIILAKNGFPMIGLNLKEGDNYIQRVHQGYQCDYEPLKELLKSKIIEIGE